MKSLWVTALGALLIAGPMTGCGFAGPLEGQVYQSKGMMYLHPAFSLDGNSILVEAYTLPICSRDGSSCLAEPKSDVLLLRPDGAQIRDLTHGIGINRGARWSADGQWIIFSSRRNGKTATFRIRPDGSDMTKLTGTDAADEESVVRRTEGPAVHADLHKEGIWVQSQGEGKRRKLADGMAIAWTPDGTALFYRSPRAGFDKNADVRRISIDGTGDRLVLEGYSVSEGWGGDPRRFWDPRGLRLALAVCREIGTLHGGVVVVDREGRVIGDFREGGFEYDNTASWSPDGNFVLIRKSGFAGRFAGVYLLDVRSGQQRLVIGDRVQVVKQGAD